MIPTSTSKQRQRLFLVEVASHPLLYTKCNKTQRYHYNFKPRPHWLADINNQPANQATNQPSNQPTNLAAQTTYLYTSLRALLQKFRCILGLRLTSCPQASGRQIAPSLHSIQPAPGASILSRGPIGMYPELGFPDTTRSLSSALNTILNYTNIFLHDYIVVPDFLSSRRIAAILLTMHTYCRHKPSL